MTTDKCPEICMCTVNKTWVNFDYCYGDITMA